VKQSFEQYKEQKMTEDPFEEVKVEPESMPPVEVQPPIDQPSPFATVMF
jgi:hypothetical protein